VSSLVQRPDQVALPPRQGRPLNCDWQTRSTGLLDSGLSIREASGRIGIGYHQARQLLRPGPMPEPDAKADSLLS
jgi:hypothetical protein